MLIRCAITSALTSSTTMREQADRDAEVTKAVTSICEQGAHRAPPTGMGPNSAQQPELQGKPT
jgi:hypothetical protein